MLKQYLFLFAVLTLGAVGGSILAYQYRSEPALQTPGPAVPEAQVFSRQQDPAQDVRSGSAETDSALARRVESLEAEVSYLRERIAALDIPVGDSPPAAEPGAGPVISTSQDAAITTIEGLVAAGIDSLTAEDMARRQSQAQLMRLDLRDRAIRKGYIGTRQYREELEEMSAREFDLRKEIDEAAYDRYLFHTGQPNRIAVDSVMLGSAAEQTGIRSGDLLYRYEDRRIYTGGDLRHATTQGDRDEPVNITVIREGSEISFTIPRGPLGVRLSSVSVNPREPGG